MRVVALDLPTSRDFPKSRDDADQSLLLNRHIVNSSTSMQEDTMTDLYIKTVLTVIPWIAKVTLQSQH